MATIAKTPSATWKAIIRKRGWPTTIKTFRTKRDAQDWARHTEDEMVRGVYIDRAGSDRILLKHALDRYLREVSSTKKPSTHSAEQHKAKALKAELGDYSLAALNPNLIAEYRDLRLAAGKSANTVRLEPSLLSHLFTIAIKEWLLGLVYNPVMNIRKPPPGQGRNRRLSTDEETILLKACDNYSNPMLSWIVHMALFTGMRAGEITSLRREQVDLTRRVVRLTDTKNGSARTVPLSKDAVQVLASVLDHPVRPLDTDLIFWGEPGRDGKRRAYEFRMAWKKIIKDTKITNLRFHDLRHEAISRLVEAGLGDQEVAAISGHKST
ncbi:MAG: integrase [endosymbiont of Seepiophila jonesi]|uniref:Integrase n=1 Tax=endosymbiont of Lamellibrachia luymesi TaxID=2200907 RepID=A0A370DZ73_9GAMM|nr:MAG: integrase [endosymbiont of Lamellibrachia luymesi]RDH94571.1 MAG: integrase [endosymbiont of Seepiophila jonesi]